MGNSINTTIHESALTGSRLSWMMTPIVMSTNKTYPAVRILFRAVVAAKISSGCIVKSGRFSWLFLSKITIASDFVNTTYPILDKTGNSYSSIDHDIGKRRTFFYLRCLDLLEN